MKYPEFFGTRFFQSALCIVEHDKQSGVSRVMASQWTDTGCGHRKLNINTQEPATSHYPTMHTAAMTLVPSLLLTVSLLHSAHSAVPSWGACPQLRGNIIVIIT